MPVPPPIYYKYISEIFDLNGYQTITEIENGGVTKRVQTLTGLRFYLDSSVSYPSTTIISVEATERYSKYQTGTPIIISRISEKSSYNINITGDTLSLESYMLGSEYESSNYYLINEADNSAILGTFTSGLVDGWNSIFISQTLKAYIEEGAVHVLAGQDSTFKIALNSTIFEDTYTLGFTGALLANGSTFSEGETLVITEINPTYDSGAVSPIPFTDFLNVSTMENLAVLTEIGKAGDYNLIDHNFEWAKQSDYWNIVDKNKDLLLYPEPDGGKVVIMGGGIYKEDNTMVLTGPSGPLGPEGPEGPQGDVGYSFLDGGTWDTIYQPDQIIDGGGW